MTRTRRVRAAAAMAGTAALIAAGAAAPALAAGHAKAPGAAGDASGHRTNTGGRTPIQHLVVIFQENVSFDHYFATYPLAANTDGQPFHAAAGTPRVNGLSGGLLAHNPNASNPRRLSSAEAMTCDQDHGYTAEQAAFDHGLMDRFVEDTGGGLTLASCLRAAGNSAAPSGAAPNYAVMDYYDGNTVTGLWNYAQHFALSDNSYGTTFGPSTPGALNVTAGNTYGAACGPSSAVSGASTCAATTPPAAAAGQPRPAGTGTVYSDADPYYDVCSATEDGNGPAKTIAMGGTTIGDALTAARVSWGWFEGGFAAPGYVPGKPSTDPPAGRCTGVHDNVGGHPVKDYIPHHEPFQYYASTANPDHNPPASVAEIGHAGPANHQYDLRDFWAAAEAGDLPAVSYLKAPAAQDGHAGYSDPRDEQAFLARTINRLERLPTWTSTAVMINWDDSDGWYDHQLGPILTQSQTPLDTLSGPGQCGTTAGQVPRSDAGTPEQARCGVGPRIPLLVISPYARANFVDDAFTTQTSIVRFVEDNWLAGRRLGNGSADAWTGSLSDMFDFARPGRGPLFLDPTTGQPESRGRVGRQG